MSGVVNAELWDRWIELWNGNLDLAEQIIHVHFEVHRIPMPHVPEGLGGRDSLVEWVKQTRSNRNADQWLGVHDVMAVRGADWVR